MYDSLVIKNNMIKNQRVEVFIAMRLSIDS